MPQQKLDKLERNAMRDAIDQAGPFLDEVGITDLSQLDEEQMDEFLRRLLVGYEHALRTRALAYEAPF